MVDIGPGIGSLITTGVISLQVNGGPEVVMTDIAIHERGIAILDQAGPLNAFATPTAVEIPMPKSTIDRLLAAIKNYHGNG